MEINLPAIYVISFESVSFSGDSVRSISTLKDKVRVKGFARKMIFCITQFFILKLSFEMATPITVTIEPVGCKFLVWFSLRWQSYAIFFSSLYWLQLSVVQVVRQRRKVPKCLVPSS